MFIVHSSDLLRSTLHICTMMMGSINVVNENFGDIVCLCPKDKNVDCLVWFGVNCRLWINDPLIIIVFNE